jgi:hypothetical protein
VSFHDLAGITQQVLQPACSYSICSLLFICFCLQANSGNLNDFIHGPTREFLEGRLRKTVEQHEDPSHNRDEEASEAQEILVPPPQLAIEVDPLLVQAGEVSLLHFVIVAK